MEKKRVLITGVAGLIGSRLAHMLVNSNMDVEVAGIDNLSGGYIDNIDAGVKFFQVDLTGSIGGIFEEFKPDYVYHFAAYAAEGLSPFVRRYNYTSNLVATANVINECINHSVNRVVFTSSMAVYGHGKPPFDERDQPSPVDPYGIAKYACEMDLRVAGEQHGLDWCVIRPHNVFGINQNIWDRYRNVLGIWMYQHLQGEPMTIFGDGEQRRAFSYVDDCLAGLWKASQLPECSKQIINLGGTKYVTINEANEILRSVMKGGKVVHKEARHEVKNAHPTWEKSVDLLGYADKTSLFDGLSTMWAWAQKQPHRERFVWGNYEVKKGIYSYWT